MAVTVGVGVIVGVSVGGWVLVGVGVMVGVGVFVANSVKPSPVKDITTMTIPATTSSTAAPPRIKGRGSLRRLR